MSPHATAGRGALKKAGRLLGLSSPGAAWSLESLCLEGEGLRARLRSKSATLTVALARDGRPLAPAAGPGEARAQAAVAARLCGARFAALEKAVYGDPETLIEELDPRSPGDYLRVPYVAGPMDLQIAGWRNFFADQDFEVQMQAPEASHRKAVTVEYADLECFLARPEISHAKWNFLDWPDESLDPEATGEESFVAVELEERDMVMGTGEKADALVSEVKRLAGEGNYLVVTHLCTPIVMGEDFQGLAKRCEREVGGTAVSWSQKDRDAGDNFGEHFKAVFARPGFFDAPPEETLVNLFHFPERVRERELVPFLEKIGLRTLGRFFPMVDFAELEDSARARWQLFCAKPSYSDRAFELLSASPRGAVQLPAPYGASGTRACLKAAADAAGRAGDFERAWEEHWAARAPEWSALTAQARSHRLAFVVSEATLPRLLAPRYGHGAPLVPLVREMGFGVDLLYYDRHGEPPRLPAGLEGASVTVFRLPAELDDALREGAFDAVYSDIFFDWRITRAGKARFSSRALEMGLDGALSGLRVLLEACRLPFYRRYGPHLRRAPRRVNV